MISTGKNDEVRMTNDEGSSNDQMTKQFLKRAHHHSDFVIPSGFGIRDSALPSRLIATDADLSELLKRIEAADRVGIDIEADSLHSYRDRLCLHRISYRTSEAITSESQSLTNVAS